MGKSRTALEGRKLESKIPGTLHARLQAHDANDVSSWTTMSQAPGQARTVVQDAVTIAVPGDASPGER